MISCLICNSKSDFLFRTTVLNKYDVSYFKCTHCNFIQTEKPYWLSEAYSSAISYLDIGLISRNMAIAPKIDLLVNLFFNANADYLDYGGGYGMLVRMMRDRGFRFYRQDIYCENLFAKNFDITDLGITGHQSFELLCAFEVLEHLETPMEEIGKMFSYSKNLLFSTELQPASTIARPEDWWYFIPEAGQHISFYSEKSIQIIAQKFGVNYYKLGSNLHLLTNNKIDFKKYSNIENSKFRRWFYYKYQYKHKNSLLSSDFNQLIGKKENLKK